MELGRYADAAPLFRQVLEERRAKLGPRHPDTVMSMSMVAAVLRARRHPEEAEPVLRQVLQIRRETLEPDHPDTLTSLSELGFVLYELRKYAEAEDLLKQAVAGRRARLGADDPDTLRSMNFLGKLYTDLGRYADAESLYRDAVAGARKRLRLSHPQTRLYINNLADLYGKQGKPALAEPGLRELAEFLRTNGGPDSPAYADQLRRLSQNLLEQDKHAEAEAAARAALAILSGKAPDAWTTSHAQSLLGAALLGQKKYADAEPLLVRGYRGLSKAEKRPAQQPHGSPTRPHVTQALERLVQLHDALGNQAEADRLRNELATLKASPER
jgi:TolA-binding protein